MKLLAIDPGPRESAFVLYDPMRVVGVTHDDGTRGTVRGEIIAHGILPNETFIVEARAIPVTGWRGWVVDQAVIEQVVSYGQVVNSSIFQTVRWAGRFEEALDLQGVPVAHLARKPIKVHLTGKANTKDAHVNAALKGRYGGDSAKGTKKAPGPLYGVSRDVWAALAVAVAWSEGAR